MKLRALLRQHRVRYKKPNMLDKLNEVPEHTPLEHLSLVVQALPSSQVTLLA